MSINKLNYTGSSKILKNLVAAVNALIDGGTGGSTTLSGLDDVALASIQDKQVLTYDSATSKWKNADSVGGGGGSNYGVFVDVNNKIQADTSFFDSASYTATEDCFVGMYLVGYSSADVQVKIDNKRLFEDYFNNVMGEGHLVCLRKGQTITITGTSTQYESYYVVYGVIGGSNPIFAPVIYSDEEREVGIWRDNKPLYQKTVTWDNPTLGRVDNLPHGIVDVDHIHILWWQAGNVFGHENNDQSWWADIFNCTSTGISYRIGPSWSSSAKPLIVTFQYTKTTDVAGSGKWNVDGVPTHHFSTEEQVVGTYFGKTLYEKGFVIGTQSFSSGQITLTNDLSGVDEVVEYGGSANEPRDNRNVPLPYMRKSWNECLTLQVMQLPNGAVSTAICTNDSWYTSLENIKIWIRYTKST